MAQLATFAELEQANDLLTDQEIARIAWIVQESGRPLPIRPVHDFGDWEPMIA
jgi:hypothetical protein